VRLGLYGVKTRDSAGMMGVINAQRDLIEKLAQFADLLADPDWCPPPVAEMPEAAPPRLRVVK
jgi:hypothetical protein